MNTIYFSPNIFSNILTFFIAEIVDGETRGTLAMTSLELADKGNYYCKVTYDTGVVVDSVTGTLEIYCKCADTLIFTGCFQGLANQGQKTLQSCHFVRYYQPVSINKSFLSTKIA